jgi:hypothetical protein
MGIDPLSKGLGVYTTTLDYRGKELNNTNDR